MTQSIKEFGHYNHLFVLVWQMDLIDKQFCNGVLCS